MSSATVQAFSHCISERRPPGRGPCQSLAAEVGLFLAAIDAFSHKVVGWAMEDNAMAESFMKTLKTEEVDGRRYRNLGHARAEIGDFMKIVYNRQRLHSALDYRSPEEFESTRPRLWIEPAQPTALLTAIPRPTAATIAVTY